MRYTNTKERRRDREEFVYMHQQFISEHLKMPVDKETINWIKNVVRKDLPYSCRTANIDIWINMKRTYLKLFA